MDARYKEMLEDATNGGRGSGRKLLFEIQHLLKEGSNRNIKHGLLPNEFVIYLADALLNMLQDPRKSGQILKIEKPKHKTRNINLTKNGTVAYMCIMAKEADPNKSNDEIFGDISVELSDDYKWLFPRAAGKDVSKKTVERIYQKTYPIIRHFKYIEGFKLFSMIQKGKSFGGWPQDITGVDNELYHGLLDEIDDFNSYLLILNEMPQMNEDTYYKIINQEIACYLKNYDEYDES